MAWLFLIYLKKLNKHLMKTKYLLVIALITSNLSAQNGFSNWDCLNSNPEAYEIYTSGGSVFSDEVNQALNEFCDSFNMSYSVIAVCFFSKQVAVKLKKV